MSESEQSYYLLSDFAAFYQEVASIKLAVSEGRLSSYLTVGNETPPSTGQAYAARVSAKLNNLLNEQANHLRRTGTAGELKMHNLARYVMAALADELFILDEEWSGAAYWLEHLIEYKQFKSRNAGVRFFELLEQVLRAPERTSLHIELASVLLLALQLGFRGIYRGEQGEPNLYAYRRRLHQFTHGHHMKTEDELSFPQTAMHLQQGDIDQRMAPLSRWMVAGQIGVAAYLLLSTSVWVFSLLPFERAFGG